MIIFTGNDICEIQRIKKTLDKYGTRFLDRTFGDSEIEYCLSNPKLSVQRLAVRFATKEAVSKALGVGINRLGWSKGIDWKDVELRRDRHGAVKIRLLGKAAKIAAGLGIEEWAVSVSHSKSDAIATVIGYKK